MEARTTSITLTTKLPILNPGEYDLWLMRIEQYFLMTDYSLWEVILNGNKVLKRKIREVEQEYEPTTAAEKQDKRNEMKARGILLMALPNKDQLKFHSYKDAKLLMEAIEKRYGGSSSETIDQTLDRLQKLISQLEIQGETISQEDMNLKLLRSLPSKWKPHALIWRNKVEIETISLDDLYNNLKIYELELKNSTNTSQNSHNVAFVSSNSTNSNNSTNEADNTAYGVSTAHTQSSPTSGDNLSDAVICAFLASQPNSPQMSREDLEQIDPDDLEEMDLQWEIAMLTVRARIFIKRTCMQLDVNGKRVGFDRTKVECYNCHKYGHFARECRLPRNQEKREKKNNRRIVTVETPNENALVAQDGIGGYDWSNQAEEEHPTNFALMAHTSSRSSSSSDSEVDSCSKSCIKAYATLKEQYDNLNYDYTKYQFNLVSYKAGLESVKARLAHYKKNEAVFKESINVLKLEVRLRDNALDENKKKLEKAEIERDELKLTLEKFQNSSKSLNSLLESQVIDKFKTRLGYNAATAASPAVERFVNSSEMLENQECNRPKGYHAVPPPYTGNFLPRKPDLTFMDEIVKSENLDVTTIVTPSNVMTVENKGVSNTVESNAVRMNNFSAPIIEDWNSDDESEIDYIVRPSTKKIESIKTGNPQQKEYKEKAVIDNGCSRHMTGNKCYLDEYKDYDGGFVSFGDGKGRISGKGKIKTGSLDFDDVYFCKELKYNLFNMSQICDKKNNVLFTETECLVLSFDFKLLGESQVLMRVLRKDNIYSVDLKSVVPTGGLTCLIAKATIDESNTWHRRLGHINLKTMNKLVKGNLPHNKTPYELIRGRPPLIDFMKPFGCPVTILNTRDHLGKFDGKADEGYFVGYSVVSKAIRVFNKRTRIVEDTLNIRFLENTSNVKGNGPDWLFNVDSLTISMNYVPVAAGKN
ncbi:ribonuclease H-like domain-containing protein [Tanacetum coccineum]